MRLAFHNWQKYEKKKKKNTIAAMSFSAHGFKLHWHLNETATALNMLNGIIYSLWSLHWGLDIKSWIKIFCLRKHAATKLDALQLLYILTASAGAFKVFINAWWALSNDSDLAQSCCLCPQIGWGHVARKRESNATVTIPGNERNCEDEGHYGYLLIWRRAVHSL